MPAIFRWTHLVTPDEIDEQNHVNNLEYLRWTQTAAVAHSAAQGWTADRYREEGSGWVVRNHFIEYLAPAFDGETIEVVTWVAGFRKVTSLRKFRVIRPVDGTLLAKAQTDWAYIGTEHSVPRRIPASLVESFEIVEDEPPL
ncbi:MAG: acyl-CoA thioesterase [Planctomycetota bacterium]|nr:acyl-CoA thioesterase [Planctomycetota bacterium]MDA1248392.1 acyl-CoA thioesterase [Planctomycetota bacterium]